MNIFVETNFVIEVALEQQEVAACEVFLQLAVEHSETTRLDEVKQRIWAIAEVLPLDFPVLQSAADCQRRFDLSAQDAIVYASIRAQLEADHAAESCFVSRNPGDFDNPDLRQDLVGFNCKYFSSFANAVQYMTHALGTAPGA